MGRDMNRYINPSAFVCSTGNLIAEGKKHEMDINAINIRSSDAH